MNNVPFYVLSFFKKGDTTQGGHYSRGDIIQGGQYLRKYGK